MISKFEFRISETTFAIFKKKKKKTRSFTRMHFCVVCDWWMIVSYFIFYDFPLFFSFFYLGKYIINIIIILIILQKNTFVLSVFLFFFSFFLLSFESNWYRNVIFLFEIVFHQKWFLTFFIIFYSPKFNSIPLVNKIFSTRAYKYEVIKLFFLQFHV